ncbi:hypothetical protein FACS1894133_2430 [Clostridia bacterium]|nr:hypothetical protein FACS1894133_2430 [Clostridia bacterium]
MKDRELVVKDGVNFRWNEEHRELVPELMTEDGVTYQLNMEQGWTYDMMEEYTDDPQEQELMEMPIGRYGRAWQRFMEEHHSGEAAVLQVKRRWEIIPRQIDEEARAMKETLEHQYEKAFPPPKDGADFAANYTYRNTMSMEINSRIMRELVLQVRI